MKNSTEKAISRTNICEVKNQKNQDSDGFNNSFEKTIRVLTGHFEYLEFEVCFGVVVVFLLLLFCFIFVMQGIELKILLTPGEHFINRPVSTVACWSLLPSGRHADSRRSILEQRKEPSNRNIISLQPFLRTFLVLVSPFQGACVPRLKVANEIIQPTGEGRQLGLNTVETNEIMTKENLTKHCSTL